MSTAAWPTSVQTIAHMYVAVNELQNNLNGSITSGATTLTLNSSTNFPSYGTVLIDNEVILYTGISGNDLTGLTRGFDGPNSVAAAHANGAVVSFAIVADHHNILAAEINAIESFLDTHIGKSTTVLASEFQFLSGVTSSIQTQLGTKVTSVSGTANQIASTGGATPVLSITNPFDPPGQIQGVAGSQSVPTYSFVGHTNTGVWEVSDTLTVSANGSVAAQFTATSGQFFTGETDGTAAGDGNVGQYVEAVVGSTNAFGTSTFGDITSISLTAGDWDVSGITNGDTTTTTTTYFSMGISTTAGNSGTGLVDGDTRFYIGQATAFAATAIFGMVIPPKRFSLTSTTTLYLKGQAIYSLGTPIFLGARLSARRVR